MRGISAIIVMILLVLISVSLVGLFFVFSSGLLTGTTRTTQKIANNTVSNMLGQMSVVDMAGNTVYVRNMGLTDLSNFSVSVNGASANFNVTPSVIKQGQLGTIKIYSFINEGDDIRINTAQGGFSSDKAPDPCKQAVLCFNMNEGSGGTVNDYSGNGNKGTIYARHENLLVYSNDFKNLVGGAWWWYGSGLIDNMIPNTPDTLAPDGTQTAVKFTSYGYGLGHYSGAVQNVVMVDGATYTASIWLKGASGGERVFVGFSDGEGGYYTLTNSWARYSYTGIHLNVNGRGFQWVDTTSGNVIYVWGAQLEKQSSAGLYTATTNTFFNDGVIAYAGQFTPWTTGKFSGGFLSDGVDDYIEIPPYTSLFPSNTITIEAWIKVANPFSSAYEGFVCRNARTNGLQMIKEWSSGKILVESVGIGSIDSNYVLVPNTWTHVVFTLDSVANIARIYINDKLDTEGAGWSLPTTTMPYWIGRAAVDTNNPNLNGIVDEVRVELDLAVVEVEVGRLGKVAIGLRIIVLIHLCHQALSFTSRWKRNYMLLALNLI
jgi:hypothetical protein